MLVLVVRPFRATLLAPIKIKIEEFCDRGGSQSERLPVGHEFVVFGPGLLLVAAQVDLTLADLDVPRLRLCPEKGRRLSHLEPPSLVMKTNSAG